MDVKTVAQDNGVVNVYVGSEPLVIGTTTAASALKRRPVQRPADADRHLQGEQRHDDVTSGQIGGLVEVADEIGGVVDNVDALAGNLIFELNKIHASGQGLEGSAPSPSTNTSNDPTLPLNDPASGPEVRAEQRQLRRAREAEGDRPGDQHAGAGRPRRPERRTTRRSIRCRPTRRHHRRHRDDQRRQADVAADSTTSRSASARTPAARWRRWG